MAKELTIQEQRELLTNPILQEVKKFELQQRMAQMLTTSTIVPDTYRGNLGNCVIAIDMAQRMNCNPLLVMQNLYIVHGNPAWSTKFLVACVNQCGRFTPLEYEVVGDDPNKKTFKVRALAFDKTDAKKVHPLYGTWITWDMVEKEGWNKKQGSKWLSMAEQMFRYRAAAFWSRIYAPEIAMGFPTQEEVIDGAVIDVDAEAMDETQQVDVETGEVTEPAPDGQVTHAEAEPQPQDEVKETPATHAEAIQQAINKQGNLFN